MQLLDGKLEREGGRLRLPEDPLEVDVEGIEPMMHGKALVNAFREDVVRPSMSREAALANAPARVGDEFLLPKIVEGAES